MFPTPYTVQTSEFTKSGTDSHGNPVETWADPIEQRVYGWAAPNSVQPKYLGQERTLVDVELYTPAGFTAGPRDRITLPDGKTFEAIGYPEDYTHGPFNWSPGLVVNLLRVEG